MAVSRTSEDFEQYELGGFRKIFRKNLHDPLFKMEDTNFCEMTFQVLLIRKIYRNKIFWNRALAKRRTGKKNMKK